MADPDLRAVPVPRPALRYAGLPHIMMRFFTVPNAKEARKSVFYATGFIGLFFLVTMVLGAGDLHRRHQPGLREGGRWAAS